MALKKTIEVPGLTIVRPPKIRGRDKKYYRPRDFKKSKNGKIEIEMTDKFTPPTRYTIEALKKKSERIGVRVRRRIELGTIFWKLIDWHNYKEERNKRWVSIFFIAFIWAIVLNAITQYPWRFIPVYMLTFGFGLFIAWHIKGIAVRKVNEKKREKEMWLYYLKKEELN